MGGENILSRHKVETVVISCIDFRFRPGTAHALKETFGIDDYDIIELAGGGGNFVSFGKEARREIIFDDVALAINAHQVSRVIILTHQNCGKYSEEGHTFADFAAERKFHQKELRGAGSVLQARFPFLEIKLGFMYVDQDNLIKIEEVRFEREV